MMPLNQFLGGEHCTQQDCKALLQQQTLKDKKKALN